MTRPLPASLPDGAFTRRQAIDAGCTERMLRGRRFTRVFPGVWTLADRRLTDLQWIDAARLALPERAQPTGSTRLRLLGLDAAPLKPLRFVVAGDLHLAIDGITLHRTESLPPLDGDGVTPTAAFVAFCRRATVVDAIAVGDWLLHRRHMTLLGLRELVRRERWRDGSAEALWVSRHLDGASRSMPESRVRAALVFAGLPTPGVNTPIREDGVLAAIADLDYLTWDTVLEYEGSHHQTDRAQYLHDIHRYGAFRRLGLHYFQITKEMESQRTALVVEVHRFLVRRGYDGPAPVFGDRWRMLDQPLRTVVFPSRAGEGGGLRSVRGA